MKYYKMEKMNKKARKQTKILKSLGFKIFKASDRTWCLQGRHALDSRHVNTNQYGNIVVTVFGRFSMGMDNFLRLSKTGNLHKNTITGRKGLPVRLEMAIRNHGSLKKAIRAEKNEKTLQKLQFLQDISKP